MSEKIKNAHQHIGGEQVAEIILDFMREFRGVYGNSTLESSLCAVGPLQSLIGLAIKNGKLATPSNTTQVRRDE